MMLFPVPIRFFPALSVLLLSLSSISGLIPSSTTTTTSVAITKLKEAFPHGNLKGIIFDMDGTLIQPCIDFADMRRRIYEVASEDLGYPIEDGDVIKLATMLSPEGEKKADEIFLDIEAKAKRDMKLMPGMIELCQFLDTKTNIKRAIVTRNVYSSIDYMYKTHMEQYDVKRFCPEIARDSIDERTGTVITAKPQPDAIRYICSEEENNNNGCWNCSPSDVIMIGDSDKDDVVAGNRAGCGATILLKSKEDNNSGNDNESNIHERRPTIILSQLSDLKVLLEEIIT